MYILIGLAVLPGIVLLVKVYRMDKIEKEPRGLVMKLVILGAVAVFFASFIENFLINALDSTFTGTNQTVALLIENFAIVALTEELLKYLATRISSWNHPAFNYSFDAIVYSVSAALGFAVLENIFYVLQGGIYVALMRAVLSVPGHAVFGFFMGVFYARAKKAQVHDDSAACTGSTILAIVIPVLLHGFYDFALSMKSNALTIAFFVFVVVLYIIAWNILKKLSREDEML